MLKKQIIGIVLLLVILSSMVLAACSNQAPISTPIKATWIKPVVTGDLVSVSASEVEKDTITHFKINTPTNELAFMVYKYDGQLYARASICPPCRSESFSLVKNTLVCDTCGTVFDAKTGSGIKGACVVFDKAAVPYEVKNGNIIMKWADLVTAFRNTQNPGKS